MIWRCEALRPPQQFLIFNRESNGPCFWWQSDLWHTSYFSRGRYSPRSFPSIFMLHTQRLQLSKFWSLYRLSILSDRVMLTSRDWASGSDCALNVEATPCVEGFSTDDRPANYRITQDSFVVKCRFVHNTRQNPHCRLKVYSIRLQELTTSTKPIIIGVILLCST